MDSYISQYSETHSSVPVRRRRRRRHRRQGVLPIVVIAILLAILVGLVVRVSVFGKIAHLEDGFDTTAGIPHKLRLPDTVSLKSLTVAQGIGVSAEEFVSGLEGTDIEVAFVQEPSVDALGTQTLELQLTRGAGSCTQTVELTRFRLVNEFTAELGDGNIPTIRSFVPDPAVSANFVGTSPDAIPEDMCGKHQLIIRCDDRDYMVTYLRTEDIPPQAVGLKVTTQVGVLPAPETLVDEIVDHSEVTATYAQEPQMTVLGEQEVVMQLTDTFGNSSQVTATVEVVPNENGPQFKGLEELTIQVGDTISYKAGVSVTDPQDGELTFTVDPGDVNTKAIGTYTAYYTATDSDGNELTVARTIVVRDEAAEAVEKYAKAVIEKIITDDMTRDQKIYKIYLYTKANVLFVGSSDKSSIVHAAYEGFSTGKGDCYTYYAMNVILLDLLGIENLEVTRVGGTSNHWWNLVLHEDGKYYHVDSCPKAIYLDGISYYKMTDKDLDTYTHDKSVFAHRPNYYTYDKTRSEYQGITIAP